MNVKIIVYIQKMLFLIHFYLFIYDRYLFINDLAILRIVEINRVNKLYN